MPRIKYRFSLSQEEREELESNVAKGKHSSQKVLSALILLNCAETESQPRSLRDQDIADVLSGQYLNRRIANLVKMRSEVSAWERDRNDRKSGVNWQFTTKDARIKLKRLYPTLDA